MHETHNHPASGPNSKEEASPPQPVLTLDMSLYEEYLEDSDLSEDQKREFLETLWSIIVSFVDLGFNISPAQQACGQNLEKIGQQTSDESKSGSHQNNDHPASDANAAVMENGRRHERIFKP